MVVTSCRRGRGDRKSINCIKITGMIVIYPTYLRRNHSLQTSQTNSVPSAVGGVHWLRADCSDATSSCRTWEIVKQARRIIFPFSLSQIDPRPHIPLIGFSYGQAPFVTTTRIPVLAPQRWTTWSTWGERAHKPPISNPILSAHSSLHLQPMSVPDHHHHQAPLQSS